MEKRQNILLTGASGTVGYEVAKQLVSQPEKFKVTLFDIKSKQSERLFASFESRAEIVYGDISDEKSVEQVCKDKDAVIHLAAIIPPLADEEPGLAIQVNTHGTANLVRGLEAYSPNAFFIYSSSVSVYGDRLKNPYIKVGDPLTPSELDQYAKTKIAAEEIIQKSKLNWSIFRLGAIMGKHKMSKLMFHMPLQTSLEIATPKDTAQAFVNALDQETALSGKIFNLGGGKQMRLSYEQFISRSFEAFGLGELNHKPYTFAEKNFHCGYYADGDELEKILNFQKSTLDTYFQDLQQSISPTQRQLTSIFKSLIKRKFFRKSEPLRAVMKKNLAQIRHFFEVKPI